MYIISTFTLPIAPLFFLPHSSLKGWQLALTWASSPPHNSLRLVCLKCQWNFLIEIEFRSTLGNGEMERCVSTYICGIDIYTRDLHQNSHHPSLSWSGVGISYREIIECRYIGLFSILKSISYLTSHIKYLDILKTSVFFCFFSLKIRRKFL